MKTCPTCSNHFPDEAHRCPKDDTPLERSSPSSEYAVIQGPTQHALPLHGSTDDPTPAQDAAAQGHPLDRSGIFESGTIFGAYRILELLGEGGMGRVYLAEHERLGRRVALKILRKEHTQNPSVIQRFFTEARAVNQINHEHIVEITDFIENEDGYSYYIMELLKGQNLGALLQEGPQPLERVIGISMQVCQALAAVHQEGFIHRDLKPDNVFLTEKWGQRDFVKLLDFGVVKLKEPPTGDELNQTSPGAIVGTPSYMSPEQASGKEVDHRSDLYSLGIILYQLISGKKPIEAKSYGEYVIKHLSVKPTRLSKLKLANKVPPRLDDVIMACLEKNPERRPQSAQEILEALSAIAQEEQCDMEQFVPTMYVTVPRIRIRRRIGLVTLATLTLGIAIVLALLMINHSFDTSAEKQSRAPAVKPRAVETEKATTKRRDPAKVAQPAKEAKIAAPAEPKAVGKEPSQPARRREVKKKVSKPDLTGTLDPFK